MSKEIEEWRPVVGYEGLYEVSDCGRVKSLEKIVNMPRGGILHKKESILSPGIHQTEHLQVQLYKNGSRKQKYIHQLVAEAFIPNPNGYEFVHHKDHNPLNNNVDNLEWINQSSHNTLHKGKIVYQYNLDGKLVAVYSSAQEAARQTSLSESHISACCRGEYGCKTHKGYKWSFVPL